MSARLHAIRSYESTSKALVKFFGDKPLDQIEPADVEKFKEWRSKQRIKPRSQLKSKNNRETSTGKPATAKQPF